MAMNLDQSADKITPSSGTLTVAGAESISGQITSTVATGTAPFVVASTTQVANLNVATAGTATNQSGGTVSATTGSFSGQITSSVGGSAISFTNATSNYLQFNTGGVAAPTFTTVSVGTKIVLYNAINASNVDYAIGVTSGTQWYSIPQNNTSYTYSWYAGTTSIATLRGDGLFTAGSFTGAGTGLTGTASSLSIGGNASTATTATTATTANALNTANSYTVAGLTVNSTGGLKVLSTNNPVVQLVANGGSAATNGALVNNWAAGTNGGVLVGTSEAAGTALVVSKSIGITSGLPANTGTSLLTVAVTGSTFSTSISAANGIIAESTAPFVLNATTVSQNYTSPANYNLMSAGPITINTGVTVTIDTTGTWVIV